jgi:tRNA1(Val) A37 N6-methylase TrmN6
VRTAQQLLADPEIASAAITADFRVLQRTRGHRYSLDDLATAREAVHAMPAATHCLDLGCGIASVLLMVAWKLPRARLWGIEALDISVELARGALALNRLEERAEVLHGDLREVARAWPQRRCQLVTGTPPYLPPGTALPSPDPQRAAARIEQRGGVEDYLEAAARVVTDDGRVVICADGRRPDRVESGAASAGLVALRRVDVLPRADAPHGPLLSVWTLARALSSPPPVERLTWVMRDHEGARTEDAHELRRCFGL